MVILYYLVDSFEIWHGLEKIKLEYNVLEIIVSKSIGRYTKN